VVDLPEEQWEPGEFSKCGVLGKSGELGKLENHEIPGELGKEPEKSTEFGETGSDEPEAPGSKKSDSDSVD